MLPENMPVQAMTTFRVFQPPRPATCAEYGCPRYLNGWVTVVPEGEKADRARSLRGRYRLFQRAGDHRGNPTGWVREFTRGDDWIDAFASNQIAVADRAERG